MRSFFTIYPIGAIHNKNTRTWIDINAQYEQGVAGLEAFSHIHVYYWFHINDSPKIRGTLQVHPMKNPDNPLTGVFATHAPTRPNLIAHSVCKCLAVTGLRIYIDTIDAHHGSPVIDIKGYIPMTCEAETIRLPAWTRTKK